MTRCIKIKFILLNIRKWIFLLNFAREFCFLITKILDAWILNLDIDKQKWVSFLVIKHTLLQTTRFFTTCCFSAGRDVITLRTLPREKQTGRLYELSGLQPLKKLFCIPCSPSKERGHSLSVLWVSGLDLLLAGRYYLCSQSVVATVIGSVPAQVSPPTRRGKKKVSKTILAGLSPED